MSLSSWLWGASQVDEAIDKATSDLLPVGTEDIALNLEIADQIRSKSVPPKDAMKALKRRLNHKNPNVQLLALSLTDTCIKNGGDHFLSEVASREFMDNLSSLLRIPGLNLDVKNKILRLVQNWASAFEGKHAFSYVEQVYRNLKAEGFNFPPRDIAAVSSAMVDTQTAPEWIDSDVCLRCRTTFSFTNRKHHCRNCGQVFDQQCSSKSLPLPHFGIAQEVRVCDSCFVKLTKNRGASAGPGSQGYGRGDDVRRRTFSAPRHRSGRDLADEELQRAIQLSLEEVGAANANGRQHRPGYAPSYPDQWQTSEPPLVDRAKRPQSSSASAVDDDENDSELRAAIEASLREQNAPRPSAPVTVETPRSDAQNFQFTRSQSYPTTSTSSIPHLPNYDLAPLESDVILTFSQTIQEVEARGGRDLSRYPAVNELYDKASGLRPKLALSLDDADRKEKTLTDMHDKLSQAVKLYDKLLTDQLERPARRMQQQQGASRYNTVDGSYGQWATPQAQSTPGPAYGTQTPAPAPTAYGLPQAAQSPPPVAAFPTSASTPYTLQRQTSYGQQYQMQPQYAQPAPPSTTAPYPQQQQIQQPQAPQYASPPPAPTHFPPQTQTQTQQQHSIPAPVAPAPYASYPQQQTQQPYAHPTSPPAQQSYPLPTSPPVPASAAIAHQAPPQPQYAASPPPPPGAGLSRQNTLSYATPVPPTQQYQQQSQGYPAPAPASAPPPPHPQQQPQHPQQHYPQFPSVPTAAPLYAPAFEQTERKEAMLIDL